MSTRSLVRFAKREDGVSFSEHPEKVIVQIYKHYDGYPQGHPLELAKYLKDFKIVNGLGQDTNKVANGLGCLAAQYVAAFKMDAGDIYVEHPDTERDWIVKHFPWLKRKMILTHHKDLLIGDMLIDDSRWRGQPDFKGHWYWFNNEWNNRNWNACLKWIYKNKHEYGK